MRRKPWDSYATAAYRKWSLPVLLALSDGPQRFSELKRGLATSTDRAMNLALKELTRRRLVDRFSTPFRRPPSTV